MAGGRFPGQEGRKVFRPSIFLFRFLSRFPLDIPVFVTVASVSRCRGLYLAVIGIL